MNFVPGLFRQAAGLAYAPIGSIIPSDNPGTFAMGIRRPVGVVAAIAPWNVALILSARSIAAPLVAGNTVVLKPSEDSPFSGGLLWAEIFTEAGLPPGVLNVVTHAPGDGSKIGTEFAEHPKVRRINFTGGSETGRRIAEAAGRNLKRVVLELGGSNPLIVLRDADLEYAVNATTFGAFLHQGQICMSARRIIVEAPIADEFTARLAAKVSGLKMGDPTEMDVIIGPLINKEAFDSSRTASRRPSIAVRACLPVVTPRGRATPPPCSRTLPRTPSWRARRRSGRWLSWKSSRTRTRRSRGPTRHRTGYRRGSSPRTSTRDSPWPSASRPASCMSTTRRWRMSRRCRSAA